MCSLRHLLLPLLAVLGISCPYAFAQVEPAQFPSPVVKHVPLWTRSLRDIGAVPDAMLLEHLSIVVSRDSERERAFQQLLRDQYDPKSALFHKWLTPQQLGEKYGADREALDEVSAWLSSHGLRVYSISHTRTIIDFSGTVASLSSALSVKFHYFDLDGDKLISITTEPSLPSDIKSKIKFIAGLSSVRVRAAGAVVDVEPAYSFNCAPECSHYVSPADFAIIYDLSSVYNSGITGSGETIAAVGFSRVTDSDIELFQQVAGLPVKDPVQRISPDGTDPGPPNMSGNTEFLQEATGDVERAFGVAPDATVILDVTAVPSEGGDISNLVNVPISDVVDNDLAPILTISFHECEAGAGMPQVLFADAVFQQAAAEGISVFVAAGDSGVADCPAHGIGISPPAAGGPTAIQSINYLCSSSYVTCVGGTEFSDASDPSKYWAPTNSSYLLSALSYIPEGAWNQSSQTQLIAGGGGTSIWIPEPPWQVGVGVPANGNRNIPDVAFTSAAHDPYYFCFAESNGDGDCSQNKPIGFYGTSGAAPSMAGIMALVNQALGGRQGNFNPTLYSLAATPSNGVFNDVTVASSGVSNCIISTPSHCNNSIDLSAGSNPPVLEGYSVTAGYDLVTGWGSINVTNLLSALTSQTTLVKSTTSLAVSTNTISTNQTTTLTVLVFGAVGTPTGTIQLSSNGSAYGPALNIDFGRVVLANVTFSTPGTYDLVAQYSGDSKYAPSSSTAVVINSILPTFQLNASSTPVVVTSPGNSATSTITASTTNGFVGTLMLSCAVTLSNGAQVGGEPTCSLSSGGQVSLTSNNSSATLTLMIGTVAAGGTSGPIADYRDGRPIVGMIALLTVILTLTLFLTLCSNKRPHPSYYWIGASLFIVSIAFNGCASPGTPPGSYTVTVTAKSGSSAASTHVNVTVN